MLELKDIQKTYESGDEKVEALKGISIQFREAEFVSILGQSGCGKTTLLNIIGGLDRYSSGDLVINGKSTKHFKDRDWDAYRNYKIGFVFQSYHLISHQTVLSNVELALTIGGISKKERKARAIQALEEVGLKEQMHKRPNQLSGGQMQRVAIARALVNHPDIILADEPTGALDTKTSVQVMEILKKISKDKLIIMVTHNPELAEQYSSRIMRIVDGMITEDTNPITDHEIAERKENHSIGKTAMKFWTAFHLSFNNLLTKKGRTILVAFAGSIGIIGIALVQSVSNGFQAYVDHIQEDTLTSYPLTIMQETTDITGMLLSMTAQGGERNSSGVVTEEQYISEMLSNLKANDLKSFKHYLENHKEIIDNDISSMKYAYSIEPNIYTKDATGKLAKLNPRNLFKSSLNMGMMSSFTSIYSQMIDDKTILDNSYEVLAGHWPEQYNEMVIVLSQPNQISDLLVYSLGLRDTEELSELINKIMSGETVNIHNEPLTFSYEDLMNVTLKLILATDRYQYNKKYKIYEDMTDDKAYMEKLYKDALELKIVGVVTAKEGVTTMALTPGIAYTSDLTDYIMENASKTEIVKKQIAHDEIDVFSGSRFDSKKNQFGLDLVDLVSIDKQKLESAFQVKIDQNTIQKQTQQYMTSISDAITTDTSSAKQSFLEGWNTMAKGMFNHMTGEVSLQDIDHIVNEYIGTEEAIQIMNSLENKYVVPKSVFKTTYEGLLKGLLQIYIGAYHSINSTLTSEQTNPVAIVYQDMVPSIISSYTNSAAIEGVAEKMANAMTEAVMKKTILTKIGELTGNLTNTFASAFNVDSSKIAGAFKLKMTEEEIARMISAMMTKKESTAKTNLISLGYQEKEEPTYISFYFKSFEGKEHFLNLIEDYNKKMKENGEESKEIHFTDTTGILMDSVKTIVNAVTYVLIAFISISLVVSSIMIGIITYISVYERTREIGILRAIGASKHNIASIFNAETFMIGLLSGLIGIGVTYAVIPVINAVLHQLIGNIPLRVTFYFSNAMKLVCLSVILTLIGGFIPARAASQKDPVIALRTE